ncbi:MAG: hypothetical protein FJX35_10810 [Alphaproteobacteria bacterium]|nr:hypothetical protein [Alphaproteobacteria bacterium]
MLTREDCIALSDLTEEEVEAIAEHEHLPLVLAAELGNYLTHCEDGIPCIKRMILDDVAHHVARGELEQARRLKLVLYHFGRNHPATRMPPRSPAAETEEHA